MKHLLVAAFITCSASAIGQTPKATEPFYAALKTCEVPPEPGFNIGKYLSKNVHYPQEARKKGIQGRVVVRFIVNEDGSISAWEVMKGIGGGCDEEAMRVISEMPKWKPGENNGQKVKVYFSQPITFRLK